MARRERLEAESLEQGKMEPDAEVLERAEQREQAKRMLEGQIALFEARRETIAQQFQAAGRTG